MRKGGAVARLQSAYDAAIQRVADLTLQVANAAARTETAELREGEVRKHVDDLKAELAALVNLHKAEQEQSSQLRQEITRMQARLEQAGEDTAALRVEVAAARTAAAAANERATADAAKASAEIKALTVACEDARRDAKEQAALAARLGGELEAVRRQADAYLALVKQAEGWSRYAGGPRFEEPCQLNRSTERRRPSAKGVGRGVPARSGAVHAVPADAAQWRAAAERRLCLHQVRQHHRPRTGARASVLVAADRCHGRGDRSLQTVLAHHPNPLSVSGGWGQLYRRVAGQGRTVAAWGRPIAISLGAGRPLGENADLAIK